MYVYYIKLKLYIIQISWNMNRHLRYSAEDTFQDFFYFGVILFRLAFSALIYNKIGVFRISTECSALLKKEEVYTQGPWNENNVGSIQT